MRLLITGAASGIGSAVAQLAVAKASLNDGPVSLALVDREERGLVPLGDELRSAGARVITIVADLEDPKEPARVVDETVRSFGDLDSLVSNAGVLEAAALADMGLELYDRQFAVNTRATLLLGQAAFPWLKRTRGSLVATASVGGVHPAQFLSGYGASKAALIMLVRQMALEWGVHGIRANTVSPGPTDSGLTRQAFGADDPDSVRNRKFREDRLPLRRIGSAEDVAKAVLFLAGRDAVHITGVDLPVDGGAALGAIALLSGEPGKRFG